MLPMQGAWVRFPSQGTRSYMPQPRVHMPQLKILHATTKTPAQPNKIKSINMKVYHSVVFKKGTQLKKKKKQQHILCSLHGQLHMLRLFQPNFFFNFIIFYFLFLFIFIFIYFFICSEFCHTLKWKGLVFTCLPHPDPPSHLPGCFHLSGAGGK